MRKPRCSAHPRALLTCKSPSAALRLWVERCSADADRAGSSPKFRASRKALHSAPTAAGTENPLRAVRQSSAGQMVALRLCTCCPLNGLHKAGNGGGFGLMVLNPLVSFKTCLAVAGNGQSVALSNLPDIGGAPGGDAKG